MIHKGGKSLSHHYEDSNDSSSMAEFDQSYRPGGVIYDTEKGANEI